MLVFPCCPLGTYGTGDFSRNTFFGGDGVLLLCGAGCSFGVEALVGFLGVDFLRDNTFFHSPSRGWSVVVTAAVLGVLGLGGIFSLDSMDVEGFAHFANLSWSVVVGGVGAVILDRSAIFVAPSCS